MKTLFDTNILINRENYEIIPENLQKLLKILNQLGASIFIHPFSVLEIKSDKNEIRKKIVLSKIKTYNELEKAPDSNGDARFIKIVGRPLRRNDEIDNALLYAVYRNAVNFLITEDKGLISKAFRLNIQDRVLKITEALDVFKEEIIEPRVTKSTCD